jgi:hypothetical protein
MFMDENGTRTVGFCLWCNRDFHSTDEVETHNANGMAACLIFQELKRENCMPPVLQLMLEEEDR